MMNCFVILVSAELKPVYRKFHKKFHLKEKGWYNGFQVLRMFFIMGFIRVCDLFPHVTDYFARLSSLFTDIRPSLLLDGTLFNLGLSVADYVIVGASVLLIFSVSLIEEKRGSVRELIWKAPAFLRYVLTYALVLAVILAGRYGVGYEAASFIYTQY